MFQLFPKFFVRFYSKSDKQFVEFRSESSPRFSRFIVTEKQKRFSRAASSQRAFEGAPQQICKRLARACVFIQPFVSFYFLKDSVTTAFLTSRFLWFFFIGSLFLLCSLLVSFLPLSSYFPLRIISFLFRSFSVLFVYLTIFIVCHISVTFFARSDK